MVSALYSWTKRKIREVTEYAIESHIANIVEMNF